MKPYFSGTRTLRGRLVVAAAGAIVGAIAIYSLVTVAVVSAELRGSLDSALRTRAQEVAQLAVSAPAVLNAPGSLESPVSGRQIVVEVVDSRARLLARSLTLGARLLPLDRLVRSAIDTAATGFEDISISGRPFRMFAAPIAQAGGQAAGGAVLVASDTTDISNTIRDLRVLLGLAGAAVALVAVLVAAGLTRRGLQPLRQLALAAGEIERTADPGRRLPEPKAADEIGQLTGVLNRMLAALARASEAERRFLADASHELRTPVTSLRGNVEYAARHGADAEVLADLERDAQRLARLVDDLLLLEREGAGAGPDEDVELEQLVRGIAAGRPRVRLGAVEPVAVAADAAALRRAVENLVENGLIHGPADGVVTVSVAATDEHARVTVRDEGPGPAADEREHVFERFWRSPGAAARPGSGLGLSIVAATAERLGGRVSVDGSAFTLELPLAGSRRVG